MDIVRCINLDWLELYCIEPTSQPQHNATFFEEDGWRVLQREYGTRVYDEMFTLFQYDTDEPLLEIRRSPVGNKTGKSIIDPDSCHIRLVNRTCYFTNAAQLLFEFCERYAYTIVRVARVDICLDFEKFDYGDDPQKFVERLLKHRYAKINQGNIRAIGKDLWDGQIWNSLSWGAPKSMVSTKLYNKTLEIAEKKDKPYIRQAWAAAGLVDDFLTLEKKRQDGTIYKPVIWRLEFSIKSSVKRWFVVEDFRTERKTIRSIHNTIDEYFTRQQLLDRFASLTEHYFHFKKFEDGKRKDRCEDKLLFNFEGQQKFYKIEKVCSQKPVLSKDEALRKKLELYKMEHYDKQDIVDACLLILSDLQATSIRRAAACPWDQSELTLLRQLIARRIEKGHEETFSVSLEQTKALLQLESDLFGELDN